MFEAGIEWHTRPDKGRAFHPSPSISKTKQGIQPHNSSSGPAAPFNNILSLMRQEYTCLQSATVIHFAARGIKRYSFDMKMK